MIFDDLKNIGNYPQIDAKIVEFIKRLSVDNPLGRVYLSDDCLTFANIDEYTTKRHCECKLEAHKKYIDIQLLLDGAEELGFTSTEGLEISENYDLARDVMFFTPCDQELNKIVLKKGNFILLYPHEAHQPQMAVNNLPSKVKKVVVKIPV